MAHKVWKLKHHVLHDQCLLFLSRGGSQDEDIDCDVTAGAPLILKEDAENRVRYTYRVTWSVRATSFLYQPHSDFITQKSDTPWATRWDNYLHIFDPVSRSHRLSLSGRPHSA